MEPSTGTDGMSLRTAWHLEPEHSVESYLGRLKLFLRYFNDQPLEKMNEIEICEYLLYLLESGHSAGSVNVCNSALRFIFGAVMEKSLNYQLIHRRRKYREFPALMSKQELSRFFSSMDNLRDRAMAQDYACPK